MPHPCPRRGLDEDRGVRVDIGPVRDRVHSGLPAGGMRPRVEAPRVELPRVAARLGVKVVRGEPPRAAGAAAEARGHDVVHLQAPPPFPLMPSPSWVHDGSESS